MADQIVFRDLPGIRRVEEIFRNPRALNSDNQFDTMAAINEVSNSLFCVTDYDTGHELEWPEDRIEDWELAFDVCGQPWEQARIFWDAIGWDLTDGNGEEHPHAHYFTRQIVAAIRGLMPEAQFHPDGTGKPAFDAWGDPHDTDAGLEERLQDEVKRFFAKRT